MKIEKGIPVPLAYRGKIKYPLAEMEVGDSFVVDMADKGRVRNAASYWVKRHENGKKFISRVVDGGVRVWRIE